MWTGLIMSQLIAQSAMGYRKRHITVKVYNDTFFIYHNLIKGKQTFLSIFILELRPILMLPENPALFEKV